MNRSLAIKFTSAILVLLALVAVFLPFVVGHPELFSASSLLELLIVLAAAGFLFKSKKIAILLLSVSALLYLGGGLLEAYSQGLPPSALRSAFYWSFAVRLSFAFWAAYLLSQPSSVLTHHSSGTPNGAL